VSEFHKIAATEEASPGEVSQYQVEAGHVYVVLHPKRVKVSGRRRRRG